MATARKEIVDLDVTRFYHCISRCVRGAQLCGGGREYRKHWLENRLQFLASHFSISVGGFAIMDSHMHVLLRIDPQDVRRWSAAEVAKRWLFLCPGRLDLSNQKEVQQSLEVLL